MKSLYRFLLLFFIFAGLILLFNYSSHLSKSNKRDSPEDNVQVNKIPFAQAIATSKAQIPQVKAKPDVVTICVVACGDRLEESLTMLKSALVFTRRPLKFIVIADENLLEQFIERLEQWKLMTEKKFEFDVRPISFPDNDNAQMWRSLFKPCAAQRLFLPSLLDTTDSILYMDTDTLFLAPPEMIWDHLKLMNSTQLAALSPEHEDSNTGWYNRFAKHPFYGKLGVNSGVMLMNLTRMREFKWTDYLVPIHKEYKLKITWGDQDIINIIFHFHPEKLYIYPCQYNYRPDHCMYMSVCTKAETEGALVLHGSRGTFHSQKQPPFRAAFKAMQDYELDTNPIDSFLIPMKNYLTLDKKSNCGKVKSVFLIQPELHFNSSSPYYSEDDRD